MILTCRPSGGWWTQTGWWAGCQGNVHTLCRRAGSRRLPATGPVGAVGWRWRVHPEPPPARYSRSPSSRPGPRTVPCLQRKMFQEQKLLVYNFIYIFLYLKNHFSRTSLKKYFVETLKLALHRIGRTTLSILFY